MKIDSIKDLDRILVLCRKRGVRSIKIDNVEFQLDDSMPQESKSRNTSKVTPTYAPGGITEDTKITTETLEGDQLLFYSSDPTLF